MKTIANPFDRAVTSYGSVPKSLLEFCQRHSDKVREVGGEGEDGYWLYLRSGWSFDGEVHAVHEHTVRDTKASLLHRVVHCECKDCDGERKAIEKLI